MFQAENHTARNISMLKQDILLFIPARKKDITTLEHIGLPFSIAVFLQWCLLFAVPHLIRKQLETRMKLTK